MNFGLSLSLWDYLFGTAYVPEENNNLELGFAGDEDFPKDFKGQLSRPFSENKQLITQRIKHRSYENKAVQG
jgi:sterol desaturase/sphingolipid hydroxylase (fatty acid hydroxylase superfamily)